MRMSVSMFAFSAAACVCTAAFAHNHITVNTASGTPGEQTLVEAGYIPAESAYSIVDGRLMHDGEKAVYLMSTPLVHPGVYNGWFGGSGLTLTSDYYNSTGRLAGGNFAYELASITPVSGGEGGGGVPSVFGWGQTHGGVFNPSALTSSADRADRSFTVGTGSHAHGQGYILTGSAWVVDVTLIAWDRNEVYTDAAPIVVRFDTGACPADFDRENGVDVADLFVYINAWLAKDAAANFDGQNSIDVADLFAYINAWLAKC